jgi:transcriptional regulator with XRE-family HTH domain
MKGDATDSAGIGDRVRAARRRLGLTREAVAFHSGLSWSAVSQVESGRRTKLRPTTLAALARALGVSIDYLVSGSPAQPPALEHSVFPYGADEQFQTEMGAFLAKGIEHSEALIAVTTSANIELLREHLGSDAGRVEFVDSSDFLITPIATLEAFRNFTDGELAHGASAVRILGEPIWAGRSVAEVRQWTRFESLFNLVFRAYPLTVVCPYDERSVAPEIVREAHLTHPHVLGEEGISPSHRYADPGRFALEP